MHELFEQFFHMRVFFKVGNISYNSHFLCVVNGNKDTSTRMLFLGK